MTSQRTLEANRLGCMSSQSQLGMRRTLITTLVPKLTPAAFMRSISGTVEYTLSLSRLPLVPMCLTNDVFTWHAAGHSRVGPKVARRRLRQSQYRLHYKQRD